MANYQKQNGCESCKNKNKTMITAEQKAKKIQAANELSDEVERLTAERDEARRDAIKHATELRKELWAYFDNYRDLYLYKEAGQTIRKYGADIGGVVTKSDDGQPEKGARIADKITKNMR